MKQKRGGVRKDRCFKVYLTIPPGCTEDEVMDYIEDAVCAHKGGLDFHNPMRRLDTDLVSVKRRSPKYGEEHDWRSEPVRV